MIKEEYYIGVWDGISDQTSVREEGVYHSFVLADFLDDKLRQHEYDRYDMITTVEGAKCKNTVSYLVGLYDGMKYAIQRRINDFAYREYAIRVNTMIGHDDVDVDVANAAGREIRG
jgi:hypothetical protein